METLNDKVAKFLAISDGDGDGCGSGDGRGSGDGWGSGRGDGDGCGCGDGWGSGRGDGDGCGRGRGRGSGDGWGDGDGCGDGDGWGSGIQIFDGHKVYQIDSMPTLIFAVNHNIAKGAVLCSDFTLTDCYIAKVGDFFAHGDTSHDAYVAAMDKALQNEPIEKRIEKFVTKYHDFDTKIPAQELFEWHYILTGSCEFGRRQFAASHGIDIKTDSFTVKEFIELTKNEYGGENIKKLTAYATLDSER